MPPGYGARGEAYGDNGVLTAGSRRARIGTKTRFGCAKLAAQVRRNGAFLTCRGSEGVNVRMAVSPEDQHNLADDI